MGRRNAEDQMAMHMHGSVFYVSARLRIVTISFRKLGLGNYINYEI